MRCSLAVVAVLAWVSPAAAESVHQEAPRYAAGAGMTLAIDGYYTEALYSLELATRLDAYHWVELGLGLGAASIDGGGSVSDQSLFEGRVGVAHVRCWRPVCGGGRVALGYLRDHHTMEDGLVSDDAREVRRHVLFGDARLLGRLVVAGRAALDLSLGLRYGHATVERNTPHDALGFVGVLALYVTI